MRNERLTAARFASIVRGCNRYSCLLADRVITHHHRLKESTGAEIETALCILESVLPTHVKALFITLGMGKCGSPSRLGPKRLLGNSETRNLESGRPSDLDPRGGGLENGKLGIWNLGVPLPWTEEGNRVEVAVRHVR